MFYDHYEALCKKSNKKPYSVAKEIGLGSSNVAQWKKGSTPRPDVLQRLSEYFGVSQAELLGFGSESEKQKTPTLESVEITLDDFTYAMHNEARDLTETDKQLLLSMARQLNNARKARNGD